VFTFTYIVYFKFVAPEANVAANWIFGISPEGIGMLGALLNFVVAWSVALVTPPPPPEVQRLIENIRLPAGVSTPRMH
jgi:cation/acetate symporter